jgi:amino acid permease
MQLLIHNRQASLSIWHSSTSISHSCDNILNLLRPHRFSEVVAIIKSSPIVSMSSGQFDWAQSNHEIKPNNVNDKSMIDLATREISQPHLKDLSAESHALRATRNDEKDMDRMGKVSQLRRNFRLVSAISFDCVLVSTWEVLLLANTQGLTDGGLAGLFWSYLWTMVGFGLIAASLAEMASMAPTSGGMYHWVSEFAPPKYQKFLSYMTGMMVVFVMVKAHSLG